MGRDSARNRRDPKLPARSPHGHRAVRRELNVLAAFPRAIQFAQIPRLALFHIRSPDLLVWSCDVTRGVSHFAYGVEFAASRINYGATIRSEPKACECHAFVIGVMRDLFGVEARRVRDPNIPHAFGVE